MQEIEIITDYRLIEQEANETYAEYEADTDRIDESGINYYKDEVLK